MTEEQIALAKRAVACKGWRWMPGMKVIDSVRMTEGMLKFTHPSDLPDLTDPATLGCLLALVREARSEPFGYVSPVSQGRWAWACGLPVAQEFRLASSEAEALVFSLEAAP